MQDKNLQFRIQPVWKMSLSCPFLFLLWQELVYLVHLLSKFTHFDIKPPPKKWHTPEPCIFSVYWLLLQLTLLSYICIVSENKKMLLDDQDLYTAAWVNSD